MDNLTIFFQELYREFNNRQVDKVIGKMTDDVKWANGMEGGHVHGHKDVKAYWTRQFTMVSSNVTPLEIQEEGETVKIKVRQVVHDLDGNLLADEIVWHFFQLKKDKIAEFNIGEKGQE